MAKKSYNPFKLWGSYVGLVLALILSYILAIVGAGFTGESLSILDFIKGYSPIDFWRYQGQILSAPLSYIQFSAFIAWGILITGFLIGYGIHALVRALRR